MRIKKIASMMGVLFVLSVGLMAVNAKETVVADGASNNAQTSERAQYHPISDVRHVIDENTSNEMNIDVDKVRPAAHKAVIKEQKDNAKPVNELLPKKEDKNGRDLESSSENIKLAWFGSKKSPEKVETTEEVTPTPLEETKSAVEEAKPAIEETKPTVEENKPAVEETKPAVEETKPAVEETKSAAEEAKPAIEETKPTVEEAKPAVEENKPAVEETKPTVEENKPAVEETKPAVEENKPTVEENKPAVEETKPAVEENKPAVEENKSAAEESKAVVEEKPVNNEVVTPSDDKPVTEQQAVGGYEAIKNKLWCVTFQLVWNTFMDKVIHGPVLLAGGNPPIANELNKKLYTSDIINPDSYYSTYGKISKKLKKQIEKNIAKKFNEKSDILDTINWGAKNSYLFYAMLKKDFNFTTPFDMLKSAPFAGSEANVKYFGVNKESDRKLRKNVHVLFYKSPDEYAVKLTTKEKEDVILYRTDKKDSFEDLYAYVVQQDASERFTKDDSLMVPNFKIDKTISYDELCGKKIKGTNMVITQALQSIKFNMDNKGGTLKSEAALAIMRMSLAPEIGRKYHFDKEFVMFLQEEGKDKPYFAVRVDNIEFLVKE